MSSSLLMDLTNKIYEKGMGSQDWNGILKALCQLIKVEKSNLTYFNLVQNNEIQLGRFSQEPAPTASCKKEADVASYGTRERQKRSKENLVKKLNKDNDLRENSSISSTSLDILRNEHCLIKLDLHKQAGHPPFTEEELYYLDCLLPHIKRTFEFSNLIKKLKEKQETLLFSLSKMPLGVIILDQNLTVNYANSLAMSLIESRLGLCIENNIFKADSDIDHRKIQNSISKLLDTGNMSASLQIKKEPRRKTLDLTFRHANQNQKMSLSTQDKQIVVYLSCPEFCSFSSEEILQNAYNLTTTEALLALSISKGLTLQNIAEGRSVSIQTVRSQLKSIFQKMNINSQSDLIRHILAGVHNLTS